MTDENPWITASKSQDGANCVQMRQREDGRPGVELRDSKNPDGPTLLFTPGEVDAFFDGVRRGEFDRFL